MLNILFFHRITSNYGNCSDVRKIPYYFKHIKLIKHQVQDDAPLPYSSWSILCDLVCHWRNKLTWAAWKHLRVQVLLSSQCFSDHTVPLHFGHLTLWTHTDNTDFHPLFFKHGPPHYGYIHIHMQSQTWASKRPSYLLNALCRSEKRRETVKCQPKIILRTCSILIFFSAPSLS